MTTKHIPRLFVDHGSNVLLDENGLPIFSGEGHPDIPQQQWEKWENEYCIVLLGEPGIGKSTEFEFQQKKLKEQHRYAFFIKIKDFYSGCTLDELVEPAELDDWKEWQNGTTSLAHIFFDSLDEARLDYDPVLKEIVGEIRSKLPFDRVRLRLSCRVRDWKNSTDKNLLKRLFPDHQSDMTATNERVKVLELLGLHMQAIYSRACESIQEPDRFFQKVQEFKIIQLCSHPLILDFLLDEFKESGALASTKTEAYSKAIGRALREENPTHGEARKRTTLLERRDIAAKIAFLSIISGYDSFYVPELDNPKNKKNLDCTLTGESKDNILETLNTKAFTGAGVGDFRFFHRSMAEFLTAELIADRLRAGMPFLKVRPLLFTSNNGIPTPLRGTVSWLSAFNRSVRNECLKYDPLVVLEGDLATYETDTKEAVIRTLVEKFRDRTWQRQVTTFGQLACGCNEKLLLELMSRQQSSAIRLMALNMIEQGSFEALFDQVLSIALSEDDDIHLRIQASSLIANKGTDSQKIKLKALLSQAERFDPEDEIAGIILYGLYPASITLDEALDSLHSSRRKAFSGMYSMFWGSHFEKVLPEADIQKALNRLKQMIEEKADEYWYDYEHRLLPELFTKLLARLLNSGNTISSLTLAPWFSLISDSRSLRDAADRQSLINIESWLRERPDIKKDLLALSFSERVGSETDEYDIWVDVPFPLSSLAAEDFEWLKLEAEASQNEWQIRASFRLLFRTWKIGDYLPSERFEIIDEFVNRHESLKDEWQLSLVRNIDTRSQSFKERQRERQKNELATQEKKRAWIREHIEEIREGSFLTLLTETMSEFPDIYYPKFSILEKEFGRDVRIAAEEGYSRAWQTAIIKDIESLWNSNSIPWLIIVLSHAIEAEWSAGRIDWKKATMNQIEAAVVIAVRYLHKGLDWFKPLYNEHSDYIETLFDRFLAIEAVSEDPHPNFCRWLKSSEVLRDQFTKYAIKYLLNRTVLKNMAALKLLLSVALRHATPELSKYLMQNACDTWKAYNSGVKLDLFFTMTFWAAWWCVDWKNAWSFLTQNVFLGQNKNHHILMFVECVSEIGGGIGYRLTRWPYDLPVDANIALVPFLYEALPPEEDPDIPGYHQVEHREWMAHLRYDIVYHISTADPLKAKKAFIEWIESPLCRKHRDWFLNVIDNLNRRIIDELWQPVSADDGAKVMFREASIIRNHSDLFTLLFDILDRDMREILAGDASLVPSLWEGTKTVGRKPRDEKPLQQLLANQLKLLLGGRPTVFAREPEVFDEKKPDFRVSAVIPHADAIHVALEVKQAHADDIWTAPVEQLFGKYMKDVSTGYGIYLVGWYGEKVKAHPKTGDVLLDPFMLQQSIQGYIGEHLSSNGEKIAVFVYDVRV